MQEGILERAVGVARARMDDETRRLVHDEQPLVLVGERKEDRLRYHGDRRCLDLGVQPDEFPTGDDISGSPLPPVDEHPALLDPPLEPHPRIIREQSGERLVQTLAAVGLWNG